MFPDLKSKYSSRLLNERDTVSREGSFRDKVRYDLVARPPYAFGLLAAADVARFCGVNCIKAIEFGVADGEGLLNMCELAPQVEQETGVSIKVVGFDTGRGLPELRDHRDHPEIWSKGDFTVTSKSELEAKLPEIANMYWGDIAETLTGFSRSLATDEPVGFLSFDVDLYSSTVSALKLLDERAECFLPVVVAYFDDAIGSPNRIGSLFRNKWCGQLRAIEEFNQRCELRKIDEVRALRHRRPFDREVWLHQTYAIHILDHPLRQTVSSSRAKLGMQEHARDAALGWEL